jgi:hypothetical protein
MYATQPPTNRRLWPWCVFFFFFATADDLPYFAFVGGLLLLFAMPVTVDEFVIFDKRVDWPAGRVFHLRMLRWKSSFMWNYIQKRKFGSFDVGSTKELSVSEKIHRSQKRFICLRKKSTMVCPYGTKGTFGKTRATAAFQKPRKCQQTTSPAFPAKKALVTSFT